MKRRDVEKVVDEALSYYHASDEPLPIGATLVSWGSQGDTPEIINEVRPKGVAERNDHFFMFTDRTCFDDADNALGQSAVVDYIYRVTPVSLVVKADYEWLSLARFEESERKARQMAKRYWSGKSVDGIDDCSTEYLTRAFRVDELVSQPTWRHS